MLKGVSQLHKQYLRNRRINANKKYNITRIYYASCCITTVVFDYGNNGLNKDSEFIQNDFIEFSD